MSDDLSRRAFVLAATALALSACGRKQPAPPERLSDRTMPPTPPTRPQMPVTPDEPTISTGRGYELVHRNAWTDAAVKSNSVLMGTVTRLTVHHTGEHEGLVGLPDIEVVSRIEKYHRNEKKWAAIGYHYLVGRDGRIYEGRPAKYQGAHVSTANENNLGVSVIGDFMRQLPNEKQLTALRAFLDDMRKRYGVSKAKVYGHRDLHSSLCPGDALYAWVKKYRA